MAGKKKGNTLILYFHIPGFNTFFSEHIIDVLIYDSHSVGETPNYGYIFFPFVLCMSA